MQFHYPPTPPVVDRLLQPGEITMMLGRQKEGKSTLALQLAIDIGGGSHFLEEFPTQTGKVLYIDFENKYEQIQKRVLDLGAKHEANLKNVAVHLTQNPKTDPKETRV